MPERLNRGRAGGGESTQGRALCAILVTCLVAGGVGAEITEAQLIQWQPVGATGPSAIIANRIILPPGETSIELELRLSGWGQANGAPQLSSYQATVASAGYANGPGEPLVPLGWPASPDDGGFIAIQVCSGSGKRCDGPKDCVASAGTCIANPRFVFSEFVPITVVSTATLDYQWGATAAGGCTEDDGQSYYGGTLVLVVPAGARGTYTIGFDGGEASTFLNNCAGTKIPGLSTIPAQATVLTVDDCAVDGPSAPCRDDCDANGICDLCEIADGSSDDCNGNSVPDPCDLNLGASFDCNNNGVPDECESDCNGNGLHDDCDVANGTSEDCNANGVPDECEPDCQPNGVADACDLLFGSSTDCNANGVPDECEPDCQPNGLADDCDLLFGISTDCNGNGTPDECEEDCNGNGVPDVCETPTVPQIAWKPKRSSAVFALCGNEILVAQGSAQVELELLLSGWGFAPGHPTLGTYQATLDTARLAGDHPDNLAAGTTAGVDLQPAVGVHGKADGAFIILRTCASSEDFSSTGQRCDSLSPPLPPCNPGEICLANPEFVFAGIVQVASVSTSQYLWGAVTSLGLCRADDGRSGHYAGTLILEVPPNATGTYTIGFDSRIAATLLNDCGGNSIPGILLTPARIRIAWCGDGLIELEEQCDDANSEGRDGCSASCTIEETWECSGTPSVCTTTCGDGALDPGETCDDGDRMDGDGCSSACRVEAQCERANLTGSDGSAGDWFGAGSAISGDFIVVGSPRFDGAGGNSGTAYVFAREPEGWRQQTRLVGSTTVGGDTFGSAVALRGDRAVIGSPGGGRTYVFQRFGDAWIEQAGLLPPESADGDEFGAAVAVDGDYIVVGAPRDDDACEVDPACDSGSAHVFHLGPGGWVHNARLTASDAQAGDRFGTSVSISGDVVAVGAHWDDKKGSRSGSVYLFRFDGSQWNEETMLTASDGAANDQFGRAVSLDGNSVVVGAWFDDDTATNAGAAYVFDFDGAAWIEEAKLVASDPNANDDFGASVTIDGDLIVVGATGNDDACDDDPGCNSGSAYLFRRASSTWVQTALINASNAAPGDRFGWSVSGSDGRAVIGAFNADIGEDAKRGTAYVFAIGGDCNNNAIPDVCDLSTGLRPDCNENGIPDDCDPDDDGDRIPDECDVCPGGDDAMDGDGDGVADYCDPCPADNPDDTDGDGVCDVDDTCPSFDDRLDADGDGVPDGCDVCPEGDDALDTDGDGVADACDLCPLDAPDDTDGDGVCDSNDTCPGGDDGLDGDEDGVADFCDPCPSDNPDDSDGDGVCDSADACPGFDDGADCDFDGVPDGCEADCQPNGVPDDCDIVAGTSTDANGNNVPDECEPGSCCYDDGTCDVSLQTDCPADLWSLDGVCVPNPCPQPGVCCTVDGVCGMTLEDACSSGRWLADHTCDSSPCVAPPRPAAYPHDRAKNRYISFDPNPANAGIPTAFRVDLKALALGSCDGNGAPCRIERGGADCGRCSDTGDACISAEIDCNPPWQSCDVSGDLCANDQAGSVGSIWWVGPESPLGNGVHLLVGEVFREIRSDWPSVVHVGDCEVVPLATYGVRVVDVQHGFESPELPVQTIQRPNTGQWADVVGTCSYFCDGDSRNAPCTPEVDSCPSAQECTPAWPPPDGTVDFDDVLAAVFAFARAPGHPQPHTTWVDLHGAGRGRAVEDPPDFVPNLTDVQFIVLAFEGRPYPFSDPADCPDVSAWP